VLVDNSVLPNYAVGDPVWFNAGDRRLPAVVTAHDDRGPLWSQFYEVTLTGRDLPADRVAAHLGELTPRN